MINRRTEKRLINFVVWFMAGALLLIMLTSCSPYEGLAAPAVSTETPARSTPTRTPTASPSPTEPSPDAARCTVQTGVPRGYLNLRTGPGVRHAVIRILVEGESLKVLERAAWLQVLDRKGTRGYVNSRYCQVKP